MSLIEVKAPSIGESITEVVIGEWLKAPGDWVEEDENIVVVESDKVNMEVPAPVAGVLSGSCWRCAWRPAGDPRCGRHGPRLCVHRPA